MVEFGLGDATNEDRETHDAIGRVPASVDVVGLGLGDATNDDQRHA